MPSIVIRLDPELLSDPNLDLRYRIPDQLAETVPDLLEPNGYDYEKDTAAMQIYLSTPDPERALPVVLEYFADARPFGNDLRKAAMIGVSDHEADAQEFQIVFPLDKKGVISVP